MLPFLPLHALAARRGDGLCLAPVAPFERLSNRATGLATRFEPDEAACPCDGPVAAANGAPPDEPPTGDSRRREGERRETKPE